MGLRDQASSLGLSSGLGAWCFREVKGLWKLQDMSARMRWIIGEVGGPKLPAHLLSSDLAGLAANPAVDKA